MTTRRTTRTKRMEKMTDVLCLCLCRVKRLLSFNEVVNVKIKETERQTPLDVDDEATGKNGPGVVIP